MGIPALPFCGLEIAALPPHLRLIQRPTTIAEHIKKRRLQLRLLQSDVSKILDVCEDTITGWENGRTFPQIQHYPKLIEFFGYNPVPTDTETLGGRIRAYRMANGISQERLAEMVGVDETTILSWEKNLHKPMPRKLTRLEEKKPIFIFS